MKRLTSSPAAVVGALAALAIGCGARPLPPSVRTDFDIVVVGAGMGGLSAAVHAANAGLRVLVLEQHSKVGGVTSSFSRGEYRFETALHEMSMGGGDGVIRTLFEQAGLTDKLELIRVPELGRSIFPGLDFVLPDDLGKAKAAFQARWPAEAKNLDEFFALLDELNAEVSELRDIFMANPLAALFTKMTVPLRQHALFEYGTDTLDEILDGFFRDEALKAVLAQFWMYYGPPPSKLWGLYYCVATHSYLKNGGWQFKGSSQALANAYRDRIIELGGTVRTGTRVTRILVADDRVHGVDTESGERFTSRYVVSNADPFQTFFELIGEDKTPRGLAEQIRAMTPSNSLVGVYLGLDVPSSFFGVKEYEIFYNTSFDADAMFAAMMAGRYEEGAISITLYDQLGDPFYAPEGKGVISIHAYSDISTWPARGAGYERHKAEVMDRLIAMAEKVLPGLRGHIAVKEGMTPRTIERYSLEYRGIPYGWEVTPDQSDRLAIETDIGGLYLAGSWAWPSHSVAMVQLSGYLAARLIMKREGIDDYPPKR